MKALPGLLIAAAFATLTFAVWAFLNRPTAEPPWPVRIQGFAFSPLRIGEDPTRKELPTVAEIDSDLKLLEGKVNAVRTYSRSEEHTSELQSRLHLVCRLLLEKKNTDRGASSLYDSDLVALSLATG